MTNQLMDNFCELSGLLIEKYSFLVLVNPMQNQAQSTKSTLGDQSVDSIDHPCLGLFQHLKLHFL